LVANSFCGAFDPEEKSSCWFTNDLATPRAQFDEASKQFASH
jgi:hypothetical protein